MKRSDHIIRIVSAALLAASAICPASAITGKWRGNIEIGSRKLPLVFNFRETADGKPAVTLDSPQQNAFGIPVDATICRDDSVSLVCPRIGATYNASVREKIIDGVFTQAGYSFPLRLTPEEDLTTRRPQTPRPPFPYTEQDTVILSADGTELAGTLVIPAEAEKGKVPVAVFVTGSGPQNRDEEIFEHRPFAVIADFLAREGIASFRYDDRGTAQSKGDYASSTIDTFTDDARSALLFARSLPFADKSGIIGHSEGGTLAVMLAAEGLPDFIVSLAGMAVSAKETILAQNMSALTKAGITGESRETAIRIIGKILDEVISQYRAGKSSPVDIDRICGNDAAAVSPPLRRQLENMDKTRSPYFDSLLATDPQSAMPKITRPVLAINGTKDTQVDAAANLGSFRRNVAGAEILEMPGLNHLLQHATTGDVSEYGEIRETVSRDVLRAISDFIKRVR